MSGLFRRNRDTRALTEDESREPALDETAGTAGLPANGTPTDERIPAGADPDDFLGPRPTTRRRGRLRKRLRHLRRVRELLLRDLGGLTYELHRTPTEGGGGKRLQAEKIARLEQLDAEMRDLEERLEDTTGVLLLREPGIGGACQSCGELYGSQARFCSNCGALLGRESTPDDDPATELAPGMAAARIDEALGPKEAKPS
jgi:hypothetical protein